MVILTENSSPKGRHYNSLQLDGLQLEGRQLEGWQLEGRNLTVCNMRVGIET
jgi:hypothetical protein